MSRRCKFSPDGLYRSELVVARSSVVRRRVLSYGMWGALICTLLVGCRPDDGRRAVRGKVTLDGQSVANAAIHFRPVHHRANSSGVAVRDGAFYIPAAQGLLPGTYEVTMQAVRETGRIVHDPQRGEVPEVVSVRLRDDTAGEITVLDVPENEFEFDLHSVDCPS